MTHEEDLWLIVGGDSTIGAALARQAGRRAICTSRRPASDNVLSLDLASDPASWVLPESIEVVFLCAAVTSIEVCRTQPAETRLVNVERTLSLARLLAARGAHVVFLSTNQVFDGSRPHRLASDPTCPQTEYGRQKAEAERGILDLGGAVVRLTKVMAEVPPLFRSWDAALREGRTIAPFEDLFFSPVPLDAVMRTLVEVGARRLSGIVQVSGACDVSYADVAKRLAADRDLVRPVSVASKGIRPEAAPRFTTLDCSRLNCELSIAIPAVFETIDSLFGSTTSHQRAA